MTDINATYRRLQKHLNKTRKTLTQVCRELDIDIDDVDDGLLQEHIDQCSHCNIWALDLIEDTDNNPVCALCFRLVGR